MMTRTGEALSGLVCVFLFGSSALAGQLQVEKIPEGLCVRNDGISVKFFAKANHVVYEIRRLPDGPNVLKGLGARLMEKNYRTDDQYEKFYGESSMRPVSKEGSVSVNVSCGGAQLLLDQKTVIFDGLDVVRVEYGMRRGEEGIEARYNAMPKLSFPANLDRCAYPAEDGVKDANVFECSKTDAWKKQFWPVKSWYASYDSKTGEGLLFVCPELETRKDIFAYAYVELVELSYAQLIALRTLYSLPPSMMPEKKSYVQFLDVVNTELNPTGSGFVPDGQWGLNPVSFPEGLRMKVVSYLMPFKGDVSAAAGKALEQIEALGKREE